MRIGEAVKLRIFKLCENNRITLNALAYKCGMTQSTINNITSGRNKGTNIVTIQKICDGLNITIKDFFNSELFDNLEQEIE